jgi:hypothetical protein
MSNRHLSILKPRLTETETSAETTETETDRDRDRPRPRLTEPERLGLGTSLGPPLCILVFGTLTLRHICQRRQIQQVSVTVPSQQSANRPSQKTDTQMIQMLFAQVLVYSLTGLAYSIGYIYTSATFIQTKDVL